ncbi:MAG: c-type cytochrome [Chloroflexi bacterium]|nr:c-type cytochrome [Chloroflexota bacterium]
MKKILKWIGIVVGALVGLIVLALAGLYLSAEFRFNKTYDITPEPVTVPTDAASLAIGKHWAEMHCQTCHGEDLGGGPFFDDPSLGYVDAPNLTAGKGGLGGANTDANWVRAIRHGIKHDGTSVFIMPSSDYYYLSDADLGGVIAYVKSVPPVDRETRPRSLAPFAKVLYSLGAFGNLLYAETIQHDVRPPAPPVGVTVDYGEYLSNANGCPSCHGPQLNGAQPSEPGAPFAPNLTPGGELVGWSEADFFKALREGVTPGGRQLGDAMPWKGLGKMTDDELKTVWLYLQSLPKLETATK